MDFFVTNNVAVLEWPSRSPDCNPMENLCGILVRSVYANGHQYHSVAELQDSVRKCWLEIPIEVLRNLIDSMSDRLVEVIIKKGGITKY